MKPNRTIWTIEYQFGCSHVWQSQFVDYPGSYWTGKRQAYQLYKAARGMIRVTGSGYAMLWKDDKLVERHEKSPQDRK